MLRRNIKENDGTGLLTRRFKVAVVCLIGFFALLITLVIRTRKTRVKYMRTSNGLGFEDESGVTRMHGQNLSPADRNILEANYFLVDLDISRTALTGEGDTYSGVTGHFCPIDWHLQKSASSVANVGMFRMLMEASKHCRSNRVKADLNRMTAKARRLDESANGKTKAMQLQGVVFHETRCGSTLVANLLTGDANRVYSESPPPVTALRACDGLRPGECNTAKQDALIRDVFYMMGRTNQVGVEQNLFFKIQSVGVRSIGVFTRALPDIPWVFVYRDSVEVMMSHFKDLGIGRRKGGNAVCLRARYSPPALLKEIAQQHGRDTKDLSDMEFCAAHLASLCESALREYDRAGENSKGRFINYSSLPDVMWDEILPKHFGIGPGEQDVERMKEVATSYSKGGKSRNSNEEWKDDSQKKQDKANEEIRDAVDIFLKGPFQRLEELSGAQ